MFKKWNRILAFLLSIALVTTTFGSDFASAKVYAEENEVVENAEEESNEETDEEDEEEVEENEETSLSELPNAEPIPQDEPGDGNGTGEDGDNTPAIPDESIYELDEEGNILYDEFGNPVLKEQPADEENVEIVDENNIEKLVTVTFEAEKGGRIVGEATQTINVNDPEASFTEVTAEAWNDKYTFIGWEDEDDVQVCADASFTPAGVEEDTTFTAKFIAAEDIAEQMPAVSAEDVECGDLVVSVSADEGLFPAGTEIKIAPVAESTAIDLAEQSLGEGNVKKALAVDITFVKDEQELQPADSKYVHVSLSIKETVEVESADAVMLHEHDGEVKEISDATVTSEGAEFDVNQFSVFIYAEADDPSNIAKKVVKYRFYDEDDKTTSNVFNEQPLKNGDTLVDPGMPKLGNNREFLKWQIETIGADGKVTYTDADFENPISNITADTPEVVNVIPLIQGTYYAKFFGEDGEVFHVETKVAVGSDPATIDISNVPDYVPSVDVQECIGWKTKDGSKVYGLDGTFDAKEVSELYPNIITSYWVRFDKNLSGATFTGAQRVKDGDALSTIKDKVTGEGNEPWCNGYEFLGWATSKAAADAGNANVDWNTIINESNAKNGYQLYGTWKANTETAYTVIFWKQNVNDSYDAANNDKNNDKDAEYTWDYGDAIRLTGETGSDLTESIVNSALSAEKNKRGSDWKIGSMNGANYTGFQYLKNDLEDGNTVEISRNGDTVINVYYTRNVITFTYNYGTKEYEYRKINEHKNDPHEGYEYYGYYYDYYGPYALSYSIGTTIKFYYYSNFTGSVYNGTIYEKYTNSQGKTAYRSIKKSNTVSGVQYYRDNKGKNKIYRKGEKTVTWTYTEGYGYGETHTGDIYYKVEKPNGSWSTVVKGLYDQTLSQGFYGENWDQTGFTWPLTDASGKYYKWYDNEDQRNISFRDSLSEDHTYTGSSVSKGKYHIRFLKQNADDDEYSVANETWFDSWSSFKFENKYAGFEVTKANLDGIEFDVHDGLIIYDYGDLDIYFDRIEYTLSYIDVSPVAEDKQAQTTIKTKQVRYGASLADCAGVTDEENAKKYADYFYAWKYWSQDVAGDREFDFANTTMPASNLAIYSGWKPVTYKLYLNPNGGTLKTVTIDGGYGVMDQKPGELIDKNTLKDTSFISKDGWDLVGWYYEDSEKEDLIGNPFSYDPLKADTYIIAKWRFSDNIDVVFDGNGHGQFEDAITHELSSTYSDGSKYASDAAFVAIGAPEKVDKGWTFIGWTVEGDPNGNVYTPNAVIGILENMVDTANKRVLVKAQYIENGGDEPGKVPTFIKYHTNLENDQVTLVTTVGDKPLYVNSPVTSLTFEQAFPGVTNEHYDFLGWSTASGDENTVWLEAGRTFTITADLEGTTVTKNADGTVSYAGNDLYAVWRPKTYKVNFNLNGGTAAAATEGQVSTAEQDVVYMHKAAQPTVDITRNGYIFKGWTLNNADYDFDTPVTRNITLTAKWEIKKYTVTFVSNGNTNPDQQTVEHGKKATKPADPSRAGYIFDTWYTDEDLTAGNEYDFDTAVTDNITLYGSWKFDGTNLTVKAKDLSKPYDGRDLVGEAEIVVPEGTVVPADLQLVNVKFVNNSYTIRNAGSLNYAIDSVDFVSSDKTVKAVTTYTKEPGTLTVTKLAISAASAGQTWQFDAQFHSNGKITSVFNGQTTQVASGKLDLTTVNGEVITFETKAKRMHLGKEKNVITVTGPEGYENNYTITKDEGYLVITLSGDSALTVTADSYTFPYDGDTHTLDSFTVTNKPADFDTYYEVEATVTGSVKDVTTGNGVENVLSDVRVINKATQQEVDLSEIGMEITTNNGWLKVSAKEVVVSAVAASKTYGDNDPDWSKLDERTTVSGLLSGDSISYTVSRQSGENVGTYTITPTGEAVQGNYHITYNTALLTILAKAVTVTADDQTKVYGVGDPELTWSVEGLVNEEDKAKLKVSTSREEGEDVGDYTITPAGDATQGNYTVSYDTGKLTITKATATVTAEAKTKVYGAADPTLTATVSGLQNGDDESVISYTLSRATGEDVGTYTITPAGAAEQGNYNVVYATADLTITKATATVTAEAKTKVYGAADPTLTATVSGLQNGDDESVISYTLSRATGEDVGTYTITPAGAAEQGNYNVVYATADLTITKATATVTAEAKTKVYGAADPTLTATVSGLQNGDDESVISYTLSRATGEDVGTYTITPAGAVEQGNYNVVYATADLTITKATATVTAEAKTKVYGAADPTLTATVSGLQNGDDESVISYTLSRATGEDVGSYTITPAGDTDQGNYTVVYITSTLTINKKGVVVTANGASKVYGAADPTFTATVSGLENGDDESVISYTLSRVEGEDVGSYTITPAGDAVQGNYNVTFVNGTFVITKATVTVTAEAKTKVYGAADPTLTATVSGLQNGDDESVISYTLSRATGEDVGTYTITPAGAAEQGNYNVVYATADLTITKATATVTAEAKTKVYGAADPTLTATVSGLQNGDDESVISYTLSRATGEDVGTYTITPAGAVEQGNYNVVYATADLTITKATATVTAEAKTKVYGAADPTLTATVSGLQNGDDESVISYTLSRATGEDVGSYTITPAGAAEQGNYNVVYATADLTITKATATVTAEAKTKVYGAADPTLTATVSGLQNGDDESVISYTLSRATGEDVGTYTITPAGAAEQGNYNVVYATADLTITKATATVTAEAKTKVYGGADPTLTATVSGLQNGDDESVISYTLSRATGEDVGTYTITPAGAAEQGNYKVVYATADLTITKATLTVAAEPKAKAYGDEDPKLTFTIDGLQNNDTESIIRPNVTITRAEGENVGSYTITPAGPQLDNYDVSYETSTLTISTADVVVTAKRASKVYGKDDPETFEVEISDLQYGESAADKITYTVSREKGETVGTYAIIPSGDAIQGNYKVQFVNGEFEITKAELKVTAKPATKVYGDDDPEFEAVVTGLQFEDSEDLIEYSVTRTDESEDVGSYTITPDGTKETKNYTVTYVPSTLTITAAPLTVTAEDKSKVYGNEDPEFTVTYEGFKFDDEAAQLSDQSIIAFEITREEGENVGSYVITPAGEKDQNNYTVTFINADFTISARTLTLTAGSNTEHVFDGNAVEVTVADTIASELTEETGLLTGNTFDFQFDTVVDEKTGRTVASNKRTLAGSQPVKIIKESVEIKDENGNVVTDNYDLTCEDGIISIASRGKDAYKVTISSEDMTITYDGKKHIYTTGYYVEGEGEKLSVIEMIWDAIKNLFTITAGAAEGIEFTAGDNTYMISGITVTAEGKDKGSYGFKADETKKLITLDVDGHDEDVTDQFDIVYKLGNLIIDPATAYVTAQNASKTEGAADPALTAIVSLPEEYQEYDNYEDLLKEAQDTIKYDVARANGQGVGTYQIVPSGDKEQGNFEVTYVNGLFTINAAPSTDDDTPSGGDTTIPDAPVALAPSGAVLGAQRATGDGPAVLGARRAGTDDETNRMARVFAMVAAAAIAVTMLITGKKKDEEEEG